MEEDKFRCVGFGFTTGKDYFKHVNGEQVSVAHVKKSKVNVGF